MDYGGNQCLREDYKISISLCIAMPEANYL